MDETRLTHRAGAPIAHAIMFWLLAGLAMAVFAPCVLVPMWCETQAVIDHERSAAAMVAALEAQHDRNADRIEALLADPLVNERIMRRELNYRPDDERVVQWPAGALAELDLAMPEAAPDTAPADADSLPAWAAVLHRWLPAWPWRKLFAESPNRSLLLAMAGGLLAAAFLLYGPAPGPSPAGDTEPQS